MQANALKPSAVELQPYLDIRVPPLEMVRYIHDLTATPAVDNPGAHALTLAQRQWGGQLDVARAATLRWDALNRAFGDKRLQTWTARVSGAAVQVSAALVAAAGIAPLEMADEQAVFDIPALLDATLEFSPVAGNA
jgi:hypothetical protein